jgi:hypothetical protein
VSKLPFAGATVSNGNTAVTAKVILGIPRDEHAVEAALLLNGRGLLLVLHSDDRIVAGQNPWGQTLAY